MSGVLVDSNVILDVLTEDPTWFAWSSNALAHCADAGPLAINPIIYAEVSIRFTDIAALEEAPFSQDLRAAAASLGGCIPGRKVLPPLPSR